MRKLFLMLILSLCLVSCGSSEQVDSTEVREEIKRPFERVYQDGDVVILVDTKTNVMYTFVNNGHGGTALTVILNADGTPRIYEGEFEE